MTVLTAQSRLNLDIFETEIGWFGVWHSGQVIHQLQFGFDSSQAARASLSNSRFSEPCKVSDSSLEFFRRDALVAYAHGERVSFADIDIESGSMSRFQREVTCACREIPYGKTRTYGELATLVGSPNAARAVGTVMRQNPFPIIVPCHRVVGASGLGGFSAHRGVETKKELLILEGALPNDRTCFSDA